MAEWKRKWRAWRALLPWERRVLARLMFWLSWSALLLRSVKYRHALGILDMLPSRALNYPVPAAMDTLEYAHRCAALCAIAARYVWFKPTCLPRALALTTLLLRDGIPAEIRFGFVPGNSPFEAHAWVVSQDQVLGHEDVSTYREFSRPCAKAEARTAVTWK